MIILLKKTSLFLILLFCLIPAKSGYTANQSTEYHALLLTNLNYLDKKWIDLTPNRLKQIKQLHKTLRKHNYTITRVVNTKNDGLRHAIDSFFKKHKNTNHKLLIFYVGYCNDNEENKPCLLSVDTGYISKSDKIPSKNSLPISNLLQQAQSYGIKQLLIAIDGSISIHPPNFDYLYAENNNQKSSASGNHDYAVIAAGEGHEYEPYNSNFTHLFNRALIRAKTNASKSLTLDSFFTIFQKESASNSFRIPWCKVNTDNATGKSLPILGTVNALSNNNLSSLTISTIPENANVRILNIKPRYNPKGHQLKAGQYTIEVSADGYTQTVKKLKLYKDENAYFTISLQKLNPTRNPEILPPPKQPAEIAEDNSGFITIPTGSFVMGGERYNEKPKHRVKISSNLQVMINEVSQRDFNVYLENTKTDSFDAASGNTDVPVVNVSWFDATGYAEWLSEKTGDHYRLPTEAEWEYIARNNNLNPLTSTNIQPGTIGIKGMPGNVMEWCSDCYHSNYSTPPNTEYNSNCSNRVVRDIHYHQSKESVSIKQLSSRRGIMPTTKMSNIGFRLVKVIK